MTFYVFLSCLTRFLEHWLKRYNAVRVCSTTLNHGLEQDKLVSNKLIHSRQSFNTLIQRPLTVGRVTYTVIRLVTFECTSGNTV